MAIAALVALSNLRLATLSIAVVIVVANNYDSALVVCTVIIVVNYSRVLGCCCIGCWLLMILSLLLSLFGISLCEYVITVVPTVVAELPFTFSFDQLVAGTFIELDTNVGLLIIELPNELEPDPVRTADEIELSTIVFVSLLTVTGTDFSVDLST